MRPYQDANAANSVVASKLWTQHQLFHSSNLQGETLAALGTGLDEMMRHVESLRGSVISMLLQVLRTLVSLGGGDPVPSLEGGAASAVTEDSPKAQPMETDGPGSSAEAGPSSDAGGFFSEDGRGNLVLWCVANELILV